MHTTTADVEMRVVADTWTLWLPEPPIPLSREPLHNRGRDTERLAR